MFRKPMRYNVDLEVKCMSKQDAKDLAAFIMYVGFLPEVDDNTLTVNVRNISEVTLDYLLTTVEGDDRIISSTFKKTPF